MSLRTILLYTVAFICSIQIGCGTAKKAEEPKAAVENMQCNSPEEFTACMRAGEFDKTYRLFAKQMTNVFSKSQFEAVAKQFIGSAGDYQSYVRTGYAEQNGSKIYDVVEKYAKGTVVTRLSYNAEDQIDGLYFLNENQALPGNIRAESAPKEEANQANPEAAPAGDKAIRDENAPALTDKFKESIVVVSGKDSCALDGYLTIPKNVEKPPVVILVHGSGSSDKDETVGPNKPFKDIAHGLAERGIAVLRYTKRTLAMQTDAGCRPEDLTRLTIREETLDDVKAAVQLMQSEPKVDASRIFVLGHSLGGMLIPAIAHENPSLKGVISVAGPVTSMLKMMIRQGELVMQELGDALPADQREKANKDIADLKAFDEKLANIPDEQVMAGASAYYYKTFDQYIAPALYKELKMPILLLQGANDMQVSVEEFSKYKELLKDHPAMESKLYPETNHLMMPSTNTKSINIQTEYAIPAHVRDEVIEDIAKFILAH